MPSLCSYLSGGFYGNKSPDDVHWPVAHDLADAVHHVRADSHAKRRVAQNRNYYVRRADDAETQLHRRHLPRSLLLFVNVQRRSDVRNDAVEPVPEQERPGRRHYVEHCASSCDFPVVVNVLAPVTSFNPERRPREGVGDDQERRDRADHGDGPCLTEIGQKGYDENNRTHDDPANLRGQDLKVATKM